MTIETSVSKPLKFIVQFVVAIVIIYVIGTSIYNARVYPLPPKSDVINDLKALSSSSTNGERDGDINFVDRQSFYYATQRFTTTASQPETRSAYAAMFKAQGWRYVASSAVGDDSSEYCKNGILGTLAFGSSTDRFYNYEITLTAGGTAVTTCN